MSSKKGGELFGITLALAFSLTVLDLANLAVNHQEETEKKQPKEIKVENTHSQKKAVTLVVPSKVAKPKI